MDHSNAAGDVTSALIIAGCLAGIFLIVRLRRHEARATSAPYWDARRKLLIFSAIGAGALYAAFVATAVWAGW